MVPPELAAAWWRHVPRARETSHDFEAPPEPFIYQTQGLSVCQFLQNPEPIIFTKSKEVRVVALVPPLSSCPREAPRRPGPVRRRRENMVGDGSSRIRFIQTWPIQILWYIVVWGYYARTMFGPTMFSRRRVRRHQTCDVRARATSAPAELGGEIRNFSRNRAFWTTVRKKQLKYASKGIWRQGAWRYIRN